MKRKHSKSEDLPDLGRLSKEEKTIILASLLVRSRSFLLFQVYILLDESFFSFLTEFSGKQIRVPSREVLRKYLSYARVYALCKNRDLANESVLLEVAQKTGIRKHQVVPIYNRVKAQLRVFTHFLQGEFHMELGKHPGEASSSEVQPESVEEAKSPEVQPESATSPEGPTEVRVS